MKKLWFYWLGEKGTGSNTGKPLHYKGVNFHRVIHGFMLQSGDFSEGLLLTNFLQTVCLLIKNFIAKRLLSFDVK